MRFDSVAAQRFDQFIAAEAGCPGPGHELPYELGELARLLFFCRFGWAIRDEGSCALLGVKTAENLECAVGAHHGVWIDGQFDRNQPHSGQLISRLKDPHGDCPLHLVDELPVHGNTAVGIEPEGKWGELGVGSILHENNNVPTPYYIATTFFDCFLQ